MAGQGKFAAITVQYPFKDFYMDDHLTQIMMLDEAKKTLDNHFLLWNFDTSKMDLKQLAKLDNMKMPGAPKKGDNDENDDSDDSENLDKQEIDKVNGRSSCCTIF